MDYKEKHSLALRWLHWINFPLLSVMVWSGLMIYWAWQPYHIGSFYFFPVQFFDTLGLRYRLAEGMSIHFLFMWLFAFNGVAYVSYLLFSGHWRDLKPRAGSLKRAVQQTLHELRLARAPEALGMYNDAQRLAYTSIVLLGFGLIVTGLAIYKPVQLGWLTDALGGYEWARTEHFCLTLAVVSFFVVHFTEVIRAGWNNFRSMITGFEVLR